MLDFEKNYDEFMKRGVQVIAASVDSQEQARDTAERYSLSYAVGYGLDPGEVSAMTGAFYNEKDGYIHSTNYIVGPDGKVVNGVYSTQAIGRLVPRDCLGLIDYLIRK